MIEIFNKSTSDDAVTATSVKLSWQTPTFYPPTTTFSIKIQDTKVGQQTIDTINNGSAAEWTVKELLPSRKYKFSIANFNKVGTKEFSKPVTITTLEDSTC